MATRVTRMTSVQTRQDDEDKDGEDTEEDEEESDADVDAEEEAEEFPAMLESTDGTTAVVSGLKFTGLQAVRTSRTYHVSPIERVQQIQELWTKRRAALLAEREQQNASNTASPVVAETPTSESASEDVPPVTPEFSAAIALACSSSQDVDEGTASLLLECWAVSMVDRSDYVRSLNTCSYTLQQELPRKTLRVSLRLTGVS